MKKPKGQKYRNLTARSGVIYYQRRVSGKKGGYQWQMTSEWRNGNSKIC